MMLKRFIFCMFLFIISGNSFSQDVTGKWNGLLKVQGIQLRLVFNIVKTESGYSSTMDSPDQNARGIPVESTTYSDKKLVVSLPQAKINYTGVFDSGKISGTFTQGGMQAPMILQREEISKNINRPQEPKPPFPYRAEEITFSGKEAGVNLSGTLTLPPNEGKVPAVILISGSGPQDRNSNFFEHKPFLVIADYLTRNGIAVLRYDDRGVGKSTGVFASATSTDFASDVSAAVAFLKTRPEIGEVGLIGHSEGGLIAPMVAASSADVKFIVLLAGTGIRGDKLMLLQQELVSRVSGMSEQNIARQKVVSTHSFDMVLHSEDRMKLVQDLRRYLDSMVMDSVNTIKPKSVSAKDYVDMQLSQLATPWMVSFLKYDPAVSLVKVKCPVLALNGSVDLQVPPKENLAAIKSSLEKGRNRQVTVKELPGLNHLFQESKSGSPAEYGEIEQSFSPVALQEMLSWIKARVKK